MAPKEITDRTTNDGKMFSAQVWDNYTELISEGTMLGLRGMESGSQKELIYKFLDTNGDGTGSINMAIDASVTPSTYYIQPPAGEVWRIARWMLYVQDAKGFDVDKWGNGIVLTNGIVPRIKQGGVITNMLQVPIYNSGDVAQVAYDLELKTFGTADDILVARWTFSKAGQYVRLVGDDGDQLQVYLNDNLSTLTSQKVQIQGYKE